MINLSSLSALIRAIRPNPADGAAPAVMRVAAVAPVAEDDAGAMMSTALRQQPRSTAAAIPDAPLTEEAQRNAPRESRAQLPNVARNASPASPPTPAAIAAIQPHSTELELTAAARVLQSALRSTGLKAPVPATITSPAPLASGPHAAPEEVARALQQAIAGSGLFYESHLARVLQRDYPLAALSREPQAAWPSGTLSPDAPPALAATTSEASAMLAKQLDVLDTRALVWTGDVWPGQRATIALREDLAGEAANDDDDRPTVSSWRMRVALDLPSLGHVEALVALRGRSVQLVVTAANEPAQERLEASKAQLANAFADSDVEVVRIDVDRDPGP